MDHTESNLPSDRPAESNTVGRVNADELYDLARTLRVIARIADTHPDSAEDSAVEVLMKEIMRHAARKPNASVAEIAAEIGLPTELIWKVINHRQRTGASPIDEALNLLAEEFLRPPAG